MKQTHILHPIDITIIQDKTYIMNMNSSFNFDSPMYTSEYSNSTDITSPLSSSSSVTSPALSNESVEISKITVTTTSTGFGCVARGCHNVNSPQNISNKYMLNTLLNRFDLQNRYSIKAIAKTAKYLCKNNSHFMCIENINATSTQDARMLYNDDNNVVVSYYWDCGEWTKSVERGMIDLATVYWDDNSWLAIRPRLSIIEPSSIDNILKLSYLPSKLSSYASVSKLRFLCSQIDVCMVSFFDPFAAN